MKRYEVTIPYRGVSKGSTRAFRGVIIDTNQKKIKVEESLIRSEFMRKYPELKPTDGPCLVLVRCSFSRPKNHYTAKGAPSKNFTNFFTQTPDADKCARTVQDALTRLVYTDDRRVFGILCLQTYSTYDFIRIIVYQDVEGQGVGMEHFCRDIRKECDGI